MNAELKRMKELAVGEHWIGDPMLLVYCLAANVPVTEVHKQHQEFKTERNGVVPPQYKDAAKLLYQVAGNVDDAEFRSKEGYDMASERICAACLRYLATVMTPAELEQFEATTPIREFKSVMEDIRAMLEE